MPGSRIIGRIPGTPGPAITAARERTFETRLLDALGEAVVATDTRGRILYWNAAAESLYGWSADEVLGRYGLDVIVAEGFREAALDMIAEVRSGRAWTGEFMVQHRDGRVFPVHVTQTALLDPDGELAGIVAVAHDITAQHKAERDLQDRELRLDLLHRATPTLQWEWSVDDGAFEWRGAADEVLGLCLEDLGDDFAWWESRIHPDDRDRVTAGLWDAVVEGQRFWTDEYGFRKADGSYATVFDRAYVVEEDGRAARVVGTLIDMSERRRLRESQRLLAQVSMMLELSLDYRSTLPGIARLTVHGFADYCVMALGEPGSPLEGVWTQHRDPSLQPALEELAGLLAESGPDDLMDAVHRSGRAHLAPEVVPDLFSHPSRQETLDGLIRRLAPRSMVVVPLAARGALLGVTVFARDREGVPYTEDDLMAAEELGRRIALTMDNARLIQVAEVANRTKSDFLAIMSHELRTPLTAVQGYADLLAQEVSGTLNAVQHRQVDRIKVGADRLLRMIEAILAFARLETGREAAQMDRIRLQPLLDRLQLIAGPQAREKGARLLLEVDGAPESARADGDKMVLILVSLVSNAIKFSDDDVVLSVHREGEMLHFDVRDRGSGIAAEHLPYVFNPFWQPERPTTRRANGAGLGLSLARRLAHLMDGDVVIVETSTRGTTVRLSLPFHGDD